MISIRQAADMVRAAPLLSKALAYDTGGAGGQLSDMLGGCAVFEVMNAGNVVGAFAVRADDYSDGRTLTVTAAGGLPGFDLASAIDAWLSLQAVGPAKAHRLTCTTRRPGLVRKLTRAGYQVTGYVLSKEVT